MINLPRRFFSIVTIPLTSLVGWQTITFSDLKPNATQPTKQGMVVEVNASSSAMVYPFSTPQKISRLTFRGSAEGLPKIGLAVPDEERKQDDYVLRLGLIEPGTNSLNFFERLFAPRWLNNLRKLWPDSSFEKLTLLKVAQAEPVGSRRIHPQSSYVEEEVVKTLAKPGNLSFTHDFSPPRSSLGLWIQSDGDGTRSQFTVYWQSLEIQTQGN